MRGAGVPRDAMSPLAVNSARRIQLFANGSRNMTNPLNPVEVAVGAKVAKQVAKSAPGVVDKFLEFLKYRQEPARKIRMAEADYQAKLIVQESEHVLEANQLKHDAEIRFLRQKLAEEANSKRVEELGLEAARGMLVAGVQATDQLPDSGKLLQWEKVYCNVSDEEVARRCGQILAGEVATPGRYSRSAMEALIRVESKHAPLIKTLASMCISGDGIAIVPLSADWGDLSEMVSFDDQSELVELGLLRATPLARSTFGGISVTSVYAPDSDPKWERFVVGGRPCWIKLRAEVSIDSIPLTVVGSQLISLFMDATPNEFNDSFLSWFVEYFESRGAKCVVGEDPPTDEL